MHDTDTKKILFPLSRLTGFSIPLGALFTEESPVIGEYPSLTSLIPFCKSAGLGIIQLLPVNDTGTQTSPYSGLSAFALHPIYISLKNIAGFSSLYNKDVKFAQRYDSFIRSFPYSQRYCYQGILNEKTALLQMLFRSTEAAENSVPPADLTAWIQDNGWITFYAVFKQLKWKYMQSSWKDWPAEDCDITEAAIRSRWDDPVLKKDLLFYAWVQLQAYIQFKKAADAVRNAGIILKGDIPILMNEDSCDAWVSPDIFNQHLRAGSPPDDQNPEGQNWGFPIYNWEALKKNNYQWWKLRLASASRFYGAYRLDHILGFFRIWAIPETEKTAMLGHTEPNVPLTRTELHTAGFDDDRIHWLSEPHIPTAAIEDITWNKETACECLSRIAERIGSEDLWNFKRTITGEKTIAAADFANVCSEEAAVRIRQKLSEYWRNRCLIEIKNDSFIPAWLYTDSVSWKSLDNREQALLKGLIEKSEQKQDQIWEKQGFDILSSLTGATPMIPCGEDLGVGLACVPEVLDRTGILALRVVRWSRKWEERGQPYIPFKEYTPLSVTTTSVHDSSTLRQWWDEEKEAVSRFKACFPAVFDSGTDPGVPADNFTPAVAEAVLSAVADSASIWCIHPLQDFLYLQKKYWHDTADRERINIPGTVSDFNWTYRMPVKMEQLCNDTILVKKIKKIADRHTGWSKK